MVGSFKMKAVCVAFILLLGIIVNVPDSLANSAGGGCGCEDAEPDSAGVNICECTPPYCYGGSFCCSISYPTTISQRQFNDYRRSFIMNSFYRNTVTPDFQAVADQSRNAALLRIGTWGAFIDASILNNTLKDLNVLSAQSIQTYTPSEQICRIGTLSKALSASEAKVDSDRLVLSEAGLAKNLGRKNSISAAGNGQENEARLRVFVEKFCDLKGNNNGMAGTCQTATPVSDTQHNRDIDYTRLMENSATLDADMTDHNLTQDENNLITMSHFLYGHLQPSKRISMSEFVEKPGTQNLYTEYRSIAARRAAAQNTFNTLASMKMAGSGGSQQYIKDVLKYIGLNDPSIASYLGPKNASYNAQMNLLTKQIYQDPAFYANLMDSKTNVKRTSAALQGIGLMQQRDTYKSMARSEMLAALLVELEARKIANNVYGPKTK